MTLSDIQFIFNRALSQTFSRKKIVLASIVLAICGLLVVFFRGLAIGASHWIIMSLTFLPFFLCAGVLLSTGIFLTRVYHDEIKHKEVHFREVLTKSWEVIGGATYFSVPIILSYLILWILLGIFVLLRQAPGVGGFFGVILSFAPFLLNLACIVLCLLNLAMLFFVAPVVALKGLNRFRVFQTLMKRLKGDVFSNLLLAFIAILPMLICGGLLLLAAVLTDSVCYVCDNPLQNVLQWFFIMIPFTALLSPTVVFFFNFAAEAHVLMQKQFLENSH